ncbi:unnamed protein product [Protopolystoma xenopodis]|uniref:Uncharacterized protein n=1 Tax=Protopolystoma xenopodis TaxID=117903 RepID=A0A3S5B0F9_9PLAT|nr:unnamed protein product [Protopolystoma xenopodis]
MLEPIRSSQPDLRLSHSLSLFSLRLYRLHAPPQPLASALGVPEAPYTSCFLIGQFGRIDAVKTLRDWFSLRR